MEPPKTGFLVSMTQIYYLQERAGLIDKQYTADKEKLHKIRLLLVRQDKIQY